jgi:hypothetical protein
MYPKNNNPPRDANIINWHEIIRLRAIKNVKRENLLTFFCLHFISSRFARCSFVCKQRAQTSRRSQKNLVIYKGRELETRPVSFKYFSLNIVELFYIFFVSYILIYFKVLARLSRINANIANRCDQKNFFYSRLHLHSCLFSSIKIFSEENSHCWRKKLFLLSMRNFKWKLAQKSAPGRSGNWFSAALVVMRRHRHHGDRD